MGEKRQFKRHRRRYRIRFRIEGGEWRNAFTSDVSVEGLFIARVKPPNTTALEIEIELDDGTTISLRGCVVRSKSIPPSLRVVETGDGFGVRLDRSSIPERWYTLQMELERS